VIKSEQRQAIEELVYRSCLALDSGDFKAFLELCDKKGMETLFTNLPRHNSDHSPLTRHATVYTVDLAGSEANVVSALQVFRTQLDGGATELFAVGRFHDTVKLNAAQPKLVRRVVKLDTRLLGYGYHIPF
jgi:methanesulfonate monooxygenase small subunit